MQDIGSVMQHRMQHSADEIASSTLQAAREGAENMKMAPRRRPLGRWAEVTSSEIDKLRCHMQRLIAGDDLGDDEGLRPLMHSFGELLVQGVSTKEQAEDWRHMAEHSNSEMQADDI